MMYQLKDGDAIEVRYTLDLGREFGVMREK